MTQIDLRKNKNAVLAFVLFVFLHSLMYFDYVGVDATTYGRFSNLLVLLLIPLCIICRSPKSMPGQYWVLGFLLVPVLSFIPCWLENGQNPITSLRAYMNSALVLVFFLLHKAQVKESDLVKGITLFALIRIIITVIQQFTFPDYLFSSRLEGFDTLGYFADIEVRSGFYRYNIDDTLLSMFLVFYYFWRLTKRINTQDAVIFLIGLLGVYIDQTRQLMVSTVLALFIFLFFSSRIRYKWAILLAVGIVSLIVVFNADILFGDLLFMTQDDMSSDNIRLRTYATYLFEFWGGPLSVVFGNGPVGNSAYGEQVLYMYTDLKLYHSDIGIGGAANLYGVVFVLFYLSFYIFYVARNWKKLRGYLKMYFMAQVINLPMICVFTSRVYSFIFMSFMIYLCDLCIKRYDRRIVLLNKDKLLCQA